MLTQADVARQNMIENQVRPWEVLDARVLDVLGAVRREDFVPAKYRAVAFADMALPIGHGETMMKPTVEGRLLQALALGSDDRVLEIGTGSGFVTACLARLARSVTSVEQHADLAETARARIAAAGAHNVRIEHADAVRQFDTGERFDAVVVTGAVHALLGPFANHGVSMTRLESRPSRMGRWEYYFFVDVEGHEKDAKVGAALAELRALAPFVKLLGSYPAATH